MRPAVAPGSPPAGGALLLCAFRLRADFPTNSPSVYSTPAGQYIEAPNASDAIVYLQALKEGGGSLTFQFRLPDGEVSYFTRLPFSTKKLVAEPVKDEKVNGKRVNASVIPHQREMTYTIEAPDINPNDITWAIHTDRNPRGVNFKDDINTGHSVTLTGDHVDNTARLTATVAGLTGKPPEFHINMLDGSKTVPVTVIIVCDTNGVRAADYGTKVSPMVDGANDILQYADMKLSVQVNGGYYHVVTNQAWFNPGTLNDLLDDMREMGRYATTNLNIMGCLKIFFVNKIEDETTVGYDTSWCMALSARADGHTLAHEVGHSADLKDIYVSYSNRVTGAIVSIEDVGVIKSEWLDPKDWGAGYYPDDLQHPDLIKRLLMNGHTVFGEPLGVCIPHGDVWGVRLIRDSNDNIVPTTEGKANVGLKGMNRNPKHEDID